MLKRRLLLASALVGVELLVAANAARAGGSLAGLRNTHTVNISGLSGKNIGGGKGLPGLNVYSPVNINNRVNSSTNINVNKSLNVYSPVNVTNHVDNSTNISANLNINNARYIDNSTNVTVNKEINVSTTNIFNGMGSGSSHSQGGSWGSHSGWGGTGGGSGNGGSSGSSNNNGNSNSNQNGSGNVDTNTVNNSNSIDSVAAINAFLNGLRGLQ
jgi:hypothetical protein